MEGADVGSIQLGTDDPLDLFRNSQQSENSSALQDRGSRMRTEADLCDSNFVHAGAAKAGVPHARLFQTNSHLALANSNHAPPEIRSKAKRLYYNCLSQA